MDRPPARALIVDDDTALSHILARCLTLWGWRVDEAPCVFEALALSKQNQHGLVLCDVDLPDGDGISLARALMKANPSLIIVVVSGDPENVLRARKAGLTASLHKPFALDKLRALIGSEYSEKR